KSRNETQCNDGGVMTENENRHCAALHSGFCVVSRLRGNDGVVGDFVVLLTPRAQLLPTTGIVIQWAD
ncbi:MAG: hypothetical protein FWE95_01020, partial [Planctomycetaceae bacterium]|nr:hypothetical protein [Planctomycetaceae bacterium]